MNLYFIDTEGTGSIDRDKDDLDLKLSAIALLMSSYLIYNSVGCIDE